MKPTNTIGDLLIQFGMITKDDLEEGLAHQRELGLKIGETLIKLGKINRNDIEWVLSKQLDIPFIIVEDIRIDSKLIDTFSKDFLLENRILPLFDTGDEIAIATDDPLNEEAFELMKGLSGKKIKISIGNGEKIEETLRYFFKTEGLPALVAYIEKIIEKIRGTSFYRIDFISRNNSCVINIYGSGILKNWMVLNNPYEETQIFEAFNRLNIQFLYDKHSNENSLFLSIYPLTNSIENISFPAIIGIFGLFLPNDTAFSDSYGSSIPSLINSGLPVSGYDFISTRKRSLFVDNTIFTIDSAPEHFNSFYVNMALPELCTLCAGKGCEHCNELGYQFSQKIEGIYSSEETKQLVHKGKECQR